MMDDPNNYEKRACGCELVRVAQRGNPWVYLRKCAQHETKEES
jgi:hypothetical protein